MLTLRPILIYRQRQDIAVQAELRAGLGMQPAEFNSRLRQELRRFGTPAIGEQVQRSSIGPPPENQGANPWRALGRKRGEMQLTRRWWAPFQHSRPSQQRSPWRQRAHVACAWRRPRAMAPAAMAVNPRAPVAARKTSAWRASREKPSAEPTLIWTRALISRVSSSSTVAWRPATLAALIGQKGMGKTMSAGQEAIHWRCQAFTALAQGLRD